MKTLLLFTLLIVSQISLGQDFDALIHNKQFAKAEQVIENANALDRAIYQAKIGDAYLNCNKLNEAAYHYLQLMDKERLKKLAFKYHENKQLYQALKYFKYTDAFSFGLEALAKHYIQHSTIDSAEKYTLKYLEAIGSRNNTFHTMVKNIVLLYLEKGEYSSVIPFAKEYAYTPTKGILAEKLLMAQQLEKAFAFRNFAKNKTVFNNKLGDKLLEINKTDLALDCFISAGNSTKQNACYLKLARINLNKGAVSEAKELYEKALVGEVMHKEIGDHYFAQKNFEKANPFYIKLPPNPKYVEIFKQMSTQMRAIDNYASAAIYLKKAGQLEQSEALTKKSFIDNDNGTISSTEFPFLWEQKISGPSSLETARKYCKNLKLAGYTNWQLPDNIALTSIAPKENKSETTISKYFPNSMGKTFWSKTKYIGKDNTNLFFVLEVKTDSQQELKNATESFYYRCYRPFD